MTEIAERLKNELAQLSPDEREDIANYLLDSLQLTDEELIAELDRRVAEMESGKVPGVPVEDVIADLRKKYP